MSNDRTATEQGALSIAHVYNYLGPQAGGPPQVIAHLSAALSARGHSCTLIGHDPASAQVDELLEAAWGSARPHLVTLPNYSFFRPLSSAFISAMRGVDLVHLHSIWPPQCVVASRACERLRLPYIISLHGHLRDEALKIKPLKKALGFSLGYRRMLERASGYHVLNESELDDLRRFGLMGPAEVIPNGAPCAERPFTSRAQLPSGLREALKGDPYLLFLSRLHPPKGARDLTLAFTRIAERHPDLHLVVAGRDEDGGAAEVLEAAREAHLMSRVHLPGFVGGEEKRATLQHATLFCLPSYHEGFSVAILEAMASEVPILISEGCHFPTVSREELGWVHALGCEALTLALDEALSHASERARRAKRAARWVQENATWERVARSFEALYQQVLS